MVLSTVFLASMGLVLVAFIIITGLGAKGRRIRKLQREMIVLSERYLSEIQSHIKEREEWRIHKIMFQEQAKKLSDRVNEAETCLKIGCETQSELDRLILRIQDELRDWVRYDKSIHLRDADDMLKKFGYKGFIENQDGAHGEAEKTSA